MSQASALKEMFGDAPEAVEAKQEAAEPVLTLLARAYLAAEKKVKAAEMDLKDLKKTEQDAETALLDAMKKAGMSSFRMHNGPLLTRAVKHQFSLPPKKDPEARAAALKWLKRVGGSGLIMPDIHPSTLTAFLRERLEAKKPISELIKDFEQPYLSVRNSE